MPTKANKCRSCWKGSRVPHAQRIKCAPSSACSTAPQAVTTPAKEVVNACPTGTEIKNAHAFPSNWPSQIPGHTRRAPQQHTCHGKASSGIDRSHVAGCDGRELTDQGQRDIDREDNPELAYALPPTSSGRRTRTSLWLCGEYW